MRSPAMSTTCFVSIRPLMLSNSRPARTATERSAGGHCTKLPSGLVQGAGPMNRHGPAAGLRGVVDGACAKSGTSRTTCPAAYSTTRAAAITSFARVIGLLSGLFAADDRGPGEQLLLPGALRVVVVHELEPTTAQIDHSHIGRRADTESAQILECRQPPRGVQGPERDYLIDRHAKQQELGQDVGKVEHLIGAAGVGPVR